MTAPLTARPSARWLFAFVFTILVAHELHELVHTGVGRAMCGAWGARDFNVWSLAPGCETWVPTLMGPLFSWAVMWTGVVLLRTATDSLRWAGVALVFAPNPLGRLLPALLGGGDEGVVARALTHQAGLFPRLLVVMVTLPIVVLPLIAAWRALPLHRRPWWFLLLFASGILVTGPLLLVTGNSLLARGVLAGPGLLGAPRLVELVTALAFAGLAITWRGLRNVPARP